MSDKKASKELNLGLTTLLSQSQERGQSTTTALSTLSNPATSIVVFDDGVERLRPELARLADSRQWHTLVSKAESSIVSEEDIEARLWWIRGHLGACTLPVSLLAAPLEAVCRNLVGDTRVEIYKGLLREIGEIMLARLRDVGDRRQAYSVGLALFQIGILEPDATAQRSFGKVPPKVPKLEGNPPLGRIAEVERPKKQCAGAFQPPRFFVFFVVAAIAMSISWIFIGRDYFRTGHVLTAVREGLLITTAVPEMIPPQIEARPVSSSLEALYFSMEQVEARSLLGYATTGGDKTAASVLGLTSKQGERRPPAPAVSEAKESVRTDGPIEGPEFSRAVERGRIPAPRLPDPMPNIEAKPVPNQSYPDGSLNIGGDIKSALVRTEVLDSPHDRARVIARLMPGDKVQVEARVGQWFRIRSRRGRVGFVFAQDIGEHEEFDVGAQPSTHDGTEIHVP